MGSRCIRVDDEVYGKLLDICHTIELSTGKRCSMNVAVWVAIHDGVELSDIVTFTPDDDPIHDKEDNDG